MKKHSALNMLTHFTLVASAVLMFTGCTGGGSGAVSIPGGGTGAGTITVDLVYPSSSGSSWTPITDGSGRYYILGRSITVSGTCPRGLNGVQVSEASVLFANETATCAADGSWTWSKVFASSIQVNYLISFAPVNADSSVGAVAATKDIRVDDVVPNAPTIILPGSPPSYTHNGVPDTTISGTVPADVVRITGPSGADSLTGAGGLTLTGTAWSMPVTLSAGASVAYGFNAFDKAGGMSAAATLNISYVPTISLLVAGSVPGGIVSGTNGFSAEMSHLPAGAFSLDSTTLYKTETGFNRLVNQKRSDP